MWTGPNTTPNLSPRESWPNSSVMPCRQLIASLAMRSNEATARITAAVVATHGDVVEIVTRQMGPAVDRPARAASVQEAARLVVADIDTATSAKSS